MVPRTLVRMVLVALAGAIVVAVVAVTRRIVDEPSPPTPVPATSAVDPLARELARCKRLRLAEADDPACRAVWTKNQDRFLGSDRRSESTGSIPPDPTSRSAAPSVEDEPDAPQGPPAPNAAPSQLSNDQGD